MSPYSTIARLRGIGVALISSICGSWLAGDRELPATNWLQRQTLRHAEAMLFVNDAQTHERCMRYLVLNHRMGADDEIAFRRRSMRGSKTLRSFAVVAAVSSAAVTPNVLAKPDKLRKCCSARISVGAIQSA